ncbi:DNA-binding transcriptional regulator, MerR family [Nonomuraea solani]|uniref:DNA-binding transcriptional regulator, MerR family n=1 Tax=Nonomuraea solani TaxID=1144553 RepID=A0A1H6EZS6_9ACTN|nr:MerR family transcriptional regulator [Nonomuraea solani]SEH03292.1 DNA-binding transcriptional regulator, MerR family [Nonomuraea solani]
MTENDRRWSIGEVAKATGVTIRTLYHYEEIGLVPASERTASGHRRYTEADLRRLYRVRALRGLGLSLEEAGGVLDRPGDDLTALRALLGAQLAELDLRAARIVQLKEQISGLVWLLDQEVMPDPERFMATLELHSVYESYFGQELRDHLARRRAELGEEHMTAVRDGWLAMVREGRRYMLDGVPVEDPRVQALTARWEAMVAGIQTGDRQVDERLTAAGMELWRNSGAEVVEAVARQIDWLDADDLPAFFGYLERARKARE